MALSSRPDSRSRSVAFSGFAVDSSRENLPMRIAVANSASELVGAMGAVLGGILSVAFGYTALFWIAIACQIAALLIVAFAVDEPRRRSSL